MILAAPIALVLAVLGRVGSPVPADPPPRAAAHPGPPVYVEVEIDETQVDVRFTGEQNTLLAWLEGPPPPEDAPDDWIPEVYLEAPLSPAQVAHLKGRIEAFFAEQPELQVDDRKAEWTVREIVVPPDDVTGYGTPALQFVLHVPLAEAPRRIGVQWSHWRRLSWFEQTRLPVLFRAFGDARLVFLTPEEPGHVWHSDSVVPREPPVIVEVQAPPPEELPVSLLSVGCGLLALLGLVPTLRGSVRWPVWLVFAASMVATGWFGRGFWVVEVPNPLVPEVAPPDAAEAQAIFESLHRNTYQAFEGRSEREIYELLQRSVTPNLLDPLYGEIYESLVMRGEGGAVCQIEGYERVDAEVFEDAEADPWEDVPEELVDRPRFELRWTWNLRGVVSHWGHEHRRLNRYEADYVVVHDGASWKIASVDILDHERVDSDG